MLLLSATSLALPSDTEYNDTINRNQTKEETNLQGFVIFNKANFYSVKESLILKEMQVVLVLEPTVQKYTSPQITFSIAELQETKNALKFKKYKLIKLKTPIAALQQAVFSSLQPQHSGFSFLFNSNPDKVCLNTKNNSPENSVTTTTYIKSTSIAFAKKNTLLKARKISKIFKLYVKPSYFYGRSAFANRPPPAHYC